MANAPAGQGRAGQGKDPLLPGVEWDAALTIEGQEELTGVSDSKLSDDYNDVIMTGKMSSEAYNAKHKLCPEACNPKVPIPGIPRNVSNVPQGVEGSSTESEAVKRVRRYYAMGGPANREQTKGCPECPCQDRVDKGAGFIKTSTEWQLFNLLDRLGKKFGPLDDDHTAEDVEDEDL